MAGDRTIEFVRPAFLRGLNYSFRIGSHATRQNFVQLVGECLDIFAIKRFRTTRFYPGRTQLFHQVPSGQPTVNAGIVIKLTARPNRNTTLLDGSRSKWNVTCNDQVISLHHFDDTVISFIGAMGNRQ